MFIAIKTDDGRIKGKISFYCKVLHVSRQAFNKFLKAKDTPWKYQALADAMLDICSEDECNDTYGRIRMYQALQLKQPEGVLWVLEHLFDLVDPISGFPLEYLCYQRLQQMPHFHGNPVALIIFH